MKINYQKELEKIIANLTTVPNLLLHSCCGPCSSHVISYLTKYFNITVFYYNPNIEPQEEYEKRKKEQIRFIQEFKSLNKLDYLDCDYDNASFKKAVKGLENEVEGGARCNKCFYLRLAATGKKARELNYDYFTTTLTVSPHKNSQKINEIGEKIAQEVGLNYIYGDFKKNDGYKKSIELAKQYNLYRQNYCGCSYQRKEQVHE